MTYDEAEEIRAYCANHHLTEIRKRARWIYAACKDQTDEPLTRGDAFVFVALAVCGLLPASDPDNHAGERYFQ